MNTPHRPTRFEPVATLPLADGTVLHRSVRTAMSTNLTAAPAPKTTLVTSQLVMSVMRGALRIRMTLWDMETGRRGPRQGISRGQGSAL